MLSDHPLINRHWRQITPPSCFGPGIRRIMDVRYSHKNAPVCACVRIQAHRPLLRYRARRRYKYGLWTQQSGNGSRHRSIQLLGHPHQSAKTGNGAKKEPGTGGRHRGWVVEGEGHLGATTTSPLPHFQGSLRANMAPFRPVAVSNPTLCPL